MNPEPINDIFKVQGEKNPANLEFYTKGGNPSRNKVKQRHFCIKKEKSEKMHCWQTYITRNIKGNSLGWGKMIPDESTGLQEVIKDIQKDNYVSKHKILD